MNATRTIDPGKQEGNMVSLSIPLILLSALHGLLPADAEQADVRRWAAAITAQARAAWPKPWGVMK